MASEDISLIKQFIKTGSSSATYNFVVRHQNAVFGLCFNVLKNREEAEEAAQDAFIKFFDSIGQLREIEKYKSWLMSIAYRKAIDFYRKSKQNQSLDETPDLRFVELNDPDRIYRQTERLQLMIRLFEKFGPVDKSILSLFYIDDMSVKDIAESLELTESNVKIKLMRARKELKEKMSPIYLQELRS